MGIAINNSCQTNNQEVIGKAKELDPAKIRLRHLSYALPFFKPGQAASIKQHKAVKEASKLPIADKVTACICEVLEGKMRGQNIHGKELHELSDLLMNPAYKAKVVELQGKLKSDQDLQKVLKSALEEAALKAKLKGVKLDPKLAERYAEDLKFLFQTRLIYSVVGFQNSTKSGMRQHEIKKGVDAQGAPYLMIKKQGQWVPVKDIKKDLQWDAKEAMLASNSNPHERWSYFEKGLVPIDRFYHHESAQDPQYPQRNAELHPVVKLSHEERQKLVEHAIKFTGCNLEKNQMKEKAPLDCVVQFVSHPRPLIKSALWRNFNAQVPVHCGLRLVMSDGSVYSTGFGSTLKEDEWNEGLRRYLATINGQPTVMDYEEFRPHEGRIVTSVPINSKRAKVILAHLNAYRRETIRFNILKQNCMRLGTNVLAMSGVHLNINVSLGTMLYRALPDAADIPVFGMALDPTMRLQHRVTTAIGAVTPECVKCTFAALGTAGMYVPSKLMTLMKNVLAYSLGARLSSPQRNQAKLEDLEDAFEDDELERFSRLLENLFDESATDIQHSAVFINWQLQQATTVVHRYAGAPSMNLMPPDSEEDAEFSEKKARELRKMYRYSEARKSSPADTKFELSRRISRKMIRSFNRAVVRTLYADF